MCFLKRIISLTRFFKEEIDFLFYHMRIMHTEQVKSDTFLISQLKMI